MIDQPADDAGLVANLVEVAEALADIGIRNLPDQAQHRRVHRIGGQERCRGIEQSGAGHDGIGLRLAGRESRTERHIGGTLLMAGVDRAEPVGESEQCLEELIVLHPWHGIDRVEPVGDESCDDRIGSGHVGGRLRRPLGAFPRLRHFHSLGGKCADRGRSVEAVTRRSLSSLARHA